MKCIEKQTFTKTCVCMAFAFTVIGGAQAQTATPPSDAGRTLNELREAPAPLPQSQGLSLPADLRAKLKAGGRRVEVQSVAFVGNAHLPTPVLNQFVEKRLVLPRAMDIAALRELVDALTDVYRSEGFPFARAFLLPGSLVSGRLTITVVEGAYGDVAVVAEDAEIVDAAAPFLSALRLGDVVEAAPLERATLLLNDLPGVSATPVMKPGKQVGTGDLSVVVEQEQRVTGGVTVDNSGTRYASSARVLADLQLNRVAVFGDAMTLTAMAPIRGNWLAGFSYTLPVGHSGARLSLEHAKTAYALHDTFEGFKGSARDSGLVLRYPLLRRRAANIGISLALRDKALQDVRLGVEERKAIQSWPLTINFDRRDAWAGGGITYGALYLVKGRVRQQSANQGYSRWMLDAARIQQATQGWQLYGHLLAQGTSDDLDSSERFSLGGASGVRAYPNGEATGDKGWLLQLEARKALGTSQAYVFYDHGRVQVDAQANVVSSPALERAGVGIGLRATRGAFSGNVALAWRTQGGRPSAESGRDPKPRIWLSARYAY